MGVFRKIVFYFTLVAVGLAAYQNSFRGVFVLDDFAHIVDNPNIRHLWPPGGLLSSTARPLVAFSLAVNYAVGGLDTWGYHLFNLAVHLLAALALWGLVRRTLLTPRLKDRYGSAASGLSLSIALLWVTHPLQTESVTYIVQRAESLMGLFFFLTLYSLVRRSNSSHPDRWRIAALVSCALGMACKPTLVVAPLIALLYEWIFLQRSRPKTWRQEKWFYLGLAATWVELAFLLAAAPREYATSAGFTWNGSSPLRYALTQPGVILHYLKLTFWPHPLILDCYWPGVRQGSVPLALSILLIGGMGLLTLWALIQRREIGFVGAWFFLTLAPTSSFIPLADAAVEHRMYVPLAAVLTLVVLCGYRVLSCWISSPGFLRRAVSILLLVAGTAALGTRTFQRNQDYFSEISIWRDAAAKRPDNPRAHNNLGKALEEGGKVGEAVACYRLALRLKPDFAAAHNNLGNALLEQGQWQEAFSQLAEALRLDPKSSSAFNDYGAALTKQGQVEQAIPWFERAVMLDPRRAETHSNLGLLLAQQGRGAEALDHCRSAVQLKPEYAAGHTNLGVVLFGLGRLKEAADHFQEAVRLHPDDPQARKNLAAALLALKNRWVNLP